METQASADELRITNLEVQLEEAQENLTRVRASLTSQRAAIARDFDSLQMAIREMDDEDADRWADFLNEHTSIFDEFTVQEEHEITVSVTIRVMARTEEDAIREVRDNFEVNAPYGTEWEVDFSVDY